MARVALHFFGLIGLCILGTGPSVAATYGNLQVSAVVAERCTVTAPGSVDPQWHADVPGAVSLACSGSNPAKAHLKPQPKVTTHRDGDEMVVTIHH